MLLLYHIYKWPHLLVRNYVGIVVQTVCHLLYWFQYVSGQIVCHYDGDTDQDRHHHQHDRHSRKEHTDYIVGLPRYSQHPSRLEQYRIVICALIEGFRLSYNLSITIFKCLCYLWSVKMVLHGNLIGLIVIQNTAVGRYKRQSEVIGIHACIHTGVIRIEISGILKHLSIPLQIPYDLRLVHLIEYKRRQDHGHRYGHQ